MTNMIGKTCREEFIKSKVYRWHVVNKRNCSTTIPDLCLCIDVPQVALVHRRLKRQRNCIWCRFANKTVRTCTVSSRTRAAVAACTNAVRYVTCMCVRIGESAFSIHRTVRNVYRGEKWRHSHRNARLFKRCKHAICRLSPLSIFSLTILFNRFINCVKSKAALDTKHYGVKRSIDRPRSRRDLASIAAGHQRRITVPISASVSSRTSRLTSNRGIDAIVDRKKPLLGESRATHFFF